MRPSLMFRIALSPLLLILTLSSVQNLFAGGPLKVRNGKPVVWDGPISYVIDSGPLGPMGNSSAANLVRGAFGTWQSVPSASFTARDEGFLPVDVTGNNWRDFLFVDCESAPSQSPVIFDSDGNITEDVTGVGSSALVLGFAATLCFDSSGEAYTYGFAVLNGTVNPFDSSFGVTVIHELGHLIGLDHTQVNSDTSDTRFVPIMFPILVNPSPILQRDDIAWVSELYPQPFFESQTGRISGKVFRRIGTPFPGANVVAVRVGVDFRELPSETVSVVSDYLVKGDGQFELPGLTPGDYAVFIEPLDPLFVGGSGVGPFDSRFTSFPKDYYNGTSESGSDLDDPNQLTILTVGAGETISQLDLISNEQANRLDLLVDDSAMLYEFPDGFLFPFYGTTYHAAMVNSDGNLTFRGDDVASDARDEQRFLSGLPRIAPLFTDLDPGERGTVRAEFNSGILRFIWQDVPEFSPEEGKPGNTFSVALFPNGNVWFGYGAISLTTDFDGTQAVVGLSRGDSGPSSTTDLSESPVLSVGDESIHETFSSNTSFDLSNQQLLFVVDEAPTGELTASPNPVSVCDGSALGRTTLSWNVPGVERVEIRIGSPVGALLSAAGSSGSVDTGSWVRDGTVFYLVDGADGSVLASEVVRLDMLGCGIRFTADPNPVPTCAEIASVTLTWEAPGTNTVEIRLGSPDGILFLQGPGTGSQQTGNWVKNGTIFYMLNADNGGVLATETVSFDRTGCPAILSADPNPIQVCDGSGVGETTLEWESDGSSVTEIRIGSPGGSLFVQSNINGSAPTGKWVTHGMEFYLVNGTNQAVLASETVFHSQQGCPANIQVTFSPNPVSKGAFGECEGKYCYRVSLREVNGVSATLLAMIVDGQDIADRIVDFFGTTRITPFGSLSVNIVHSRSSGFSTWEFVTIDANGNTNSSSGTVQLLQ